MAHFSVAAVTHQPVTVADVLGWYESNEVRSYSPVALKERRRLWGLFRTHCGGLVVDEARPFHLLEFISAQKWSRSNNTRRRFRSTICRPFNAAARLGMIARNPFAGVEIPEGGKGRDWTDGEYRALLR